MSKQLKVLIILWDVMIVVSVPIMSFFLYKEWQMLNELAIAMHLL